MHDGWAARIPPKAGFVRPSLCSSLPCPTPAVEWPAMLWVEGGRRTGSAALAQGFCRAMLNRLRGFEAIAVSFSRRQHIELCSRATRAEAVCLCLCVCVCRWLCPLACLRDSANAVACVSSSSYSVSCLTRQFSCCFCFFSA